MVHLTGALQKFIKDVNGQQESKPKHEEKSALEEEGHQAGTGCNTLFPVLKDCVPFLHSLTSCPVSRKLKFAKFLPQTLHERLWIFFHVHLPIKFECDPNPNKMMQLCPLKKLDIKIMTLHVDYWFEALCLIFKRLLVARPIN